MKSRARLVLGGLRSLARGVAAAACSKARDAVPRGTSRDRRRSRAPPADCGHAVCADNFFVDAAPAELHRGPPCSVTLKLVATGDFHINDEYPYKFKADDAPGVRSSAPTPTARTRSRRPPGDWQKADAKTGAMTVKFTPPTRRRQGRSPAPSSSASAPPRPASSSSGR